MGYYIELEVKGQFTEEGAKVFKKIESGEIVSYIDLPSYIDRHENNCFRLYKKQRYDTDLEETYEKFIKDFLVPMTTELTHCCISHDFLGDHYHTYTDDELREAHFIVAYTKPPSPKVQYGKRVVTPKSKPKLLSYIKLYPIVYDSDVDTWPRDLRRWWSSINKENALDISGALRKHYPDDEWLMEIADWIDENMSRFADIDLHFEHTCNLKGFHD